jgi:hypothetical protein
MGFAESGGPDDSLTEAIASGMLRASPALAERLAVTESELSRLKAERNRKEPALDKILPRIGKRYLEIVEHLEEGLRGDPERARAALTDAIGSRITLESDASGKFVWAEFGNHTAARSGGYAGNYGSGGPLRAL